MFKKLARKLLYSRGFRQLIRWAGQIVLPGFEGFNLYNISRFFVRALTKGNIVMRASAISFKLFVAFFPAVIVLLTMIPYIPIPDFQAKLLVTFHDMLPLEVYKFIESTLHDLLVRKHGTLLSVSFLVGVFMASDSIDAILLGFSGSSNHSTWHSPLKQRVLSIGLLLALTVLTMIAIPLLTFSGSIIYKLEELHFFSSYFQLAALFLVKWIVSILVVVLFVSLLYNAGDPTTKRFRLFTPGAILAMLLIMLVSQALAFVFSNITDYNALYGSIGAILAVQLWLYFNMIVLLIGYELNTSIMRARNHRSAHLQLKEKT
ncbi:MAG TPA: YihY/virulence factor BrkB family protein [Flavobacteriales bacterium]|nr:YihY/virulence factor BrkB family protein [Flavobacteriales bacterium]HQW39567.1 YihY/virulence factor BrkB family protein [Flavobacteriales bacterium]